MITHIAAIVGCLGQVMETSSAQRCAIEVDRAIREAGYEVVPSGVSHLALCRGSWVLGTACGRCARCMDDAPRFIAALRKAIETHERTLVRVHAHVPPRPPGDWDFKDEFKAKLFDGLRGELYQEEK